MIRNNALTKTGLLMAALTVMMTACEYKGLDELTATPKMATVRLSFDWSLVDSIPTEMRVIFYPMGDKTGTRGYTTFDVLNRDTVIDIPAGFYDLTAWNRDIEHVITTGYSSQNSVNATTGTYSPHGNYLMPKVLDSLFYGLPVLDYPDYMVHTHKMGVEIDLEKPEQRITLIPDSMVVTVEMKLHGIKGLERCKNVRAAISNVAGRRYMSFDNLTEDVVAVMFDAEGHAEDSLVTAKFWIFGIEPTSSDRMTHDLIVFFWLDAGQIYIPLNITKTMSAYRKDDKYVLIESPDLGINLNDYVINSGAFDVDVDDWENINIPVEF